ncbi:hypothetical protein U1Q18_033311 [Sarracenia purpurea var. burkii]
MVPAPRGDNNGHVGLGVEVQSQGAEIFLESKLCKSSVGDDEEKHPELQARRLDSVWSVLPHSQRRKSTLILLSDLGKIRGDGITVFNRNFDSRGDWVSWQSGNQGDLQTGEVVTAILEKSPELQAARQGYRGAVFIKN